MNLSGKKSSSLQTGRIVSSQDTQHGNHGSVTNENPEPSLPSTIAHPPGARRQESHAHEIFAYSNPEHDPVVVSQQIDLASKNNPPQSQLRSDKTLKRRKSFFDTLLGRDSPATPDISTLPISPQKIRSTKSAADGLRQMFRFQGNSKTANTADTSNFSAFGNEEVVARRKLTPRKSLLDLVGFKSGASRATSSNALKENTLSVDPDSVAALSSGGFTLSDIAAETKISKPLMPFTLNSQLNLNADQVKEFFGIDKKIELTLVSSILKDDLFPPPDHPEKGRVAFENYFAPGILVLGSNFKDKDLTSVRFSDVLEIQREKTGFQKELNHIVIANIISKDTESFFKEHKFLDNTLMSEDQVREFLDIKGLGKSTKYIIDDVQSEVVQARVLTEHGIYVIFELAAMGHTGG